MERLIGNQIDSVRHERLMGRDYLVAPMVLIVEGILAGSEGPLLYLNEDIELSCDAWNMMPMVLGHPMSLQGEGISARSPEVLDKLFLGFVLRSRVDPRLLAEGWFDIPRTNKVRGDILSSLTQGRPIGLSTGLFTQRKEVPPGSTYEGQPYDAIATNYRPDHLAILPDELGACSLADGCGVLSNSDSHQPRVKRCRNAKNSGRVNGAHRFSKKENR